MSDEIIYTNSQIKKLQDKIKNNLFATATIKVRDVRHISNSYMYIMNNAYRIEGHSSDIAKNGYSYPVIWNKNIDGFYQNYFYVVDPNNPNKIVALTDDDTLIVKYIDLELLQ